MKKIVLCVAVLAGLVSFRSANELTTNSSIPQPNLKMLDVSGSEFSLNDIKKEKGLLVIFISNSCPYLGKNQVELQEACAHAFTQGIGVALINSNDKLRAGSESIEEMKKNAQLKNIGFSKYLVDKNYELAKAFGVTKNMECFLFDKTGLVYKGALTDNLEHPESIKYSYVTDAVGSVMHGTAPAISSTPAAGCEIN